MINTWFLCCNFAQYNRPRRNLPKTRWIKQQNDDTHLNKSWKHFMSTFIVFFIYSWIPLVELRIAIIWSDVVVVLDLGCKPNAYKARWLHLPCYLWIVCERSGKAYVWSNNKLSQSDFELDLMVPFSMLLAVRLGSKQTIGEKKTEERGNGMTKRSCFNLNASLVKLVNMSDIMYGIQVIVPPKVPLLFWFHAVHFNSVIKKKQELKR